MKLKERKKNKLEKTKCRGKRISEGKGEKKNLVDF